MGVPYRIRLVRYRVLLFHGLFWLCHDLVLWLTLRENCEYEMFGGWCVWMWDVKKMLLGLKNVRLCKIFVDVKFCGSDQFGSVSCFLLLFLLIDPPTARERVPTKCGGSSPIPPNLDNCVRNTPRYCYMTKKSTSTPNTHSPNTSYIITLWM